MTSLKSIEILNDHDQTDEDRRIRELAEAFVALSRGEVVAVKADRLAELELAEKTLLALQTASVDNLDD